MIVGIGTDLVDLDRFRGLLDRRRSLVERLFTPGERAYAEAAHDPTERFAVRFAAKEAVLKALGRGAGCGALARHRGDPRRRRPSRAADLGRGRRAGRPGGRGRRGG